MASTMSPPSSCAKLGWNHGESPAPTEVDSLPELDYWNLPRDDWMGLGGDQDPFDLKYEIDRAKSHKDFARFMEWYLYKYQLEEYEFGREDWDPLDDLQHFAQWLVESGQGSWEHQTNDVTVGDDSDVIVESHDLLPDNQLGDSNLYPLGPNVERVTESYEEPQKRLLGSIPYSKGKWPQLLGELMSDRTWWRDHFVIGGGFVLDFVSASELNHCPAKSQFPLLVYCLEPPSASSTDYQEKGDDDSKVQEVQQLPDTRTGLETPNIVPAEAGDPSAHSWGLEESTPTGEGAWDLNGWDFREEWEAYEANSGFEPDTFEKDLNAEYSTLACIFNMIKQRTICLKHLNFNPVVTSAIGVISA